MTEDTFWGLIDMVPIYDVANDLGGAADDNDLKDLEAKLAQLSDTDTIAFFHLFSTKLHALDTPAHYDACRVGGGEASQDVFLYARCHLLMLGRDRYEDVLNTRPTSHPTSGSKTSSASPTKPMTGSTTATPTRVATPIMKRSPTTRGTPHDRPL